MSNEDLSERQITWDIALQVLGCLVTPTVCYHYFIEKYFHPTGDNWSSEALVDSSSVGIYMTDKV
jgi:hypothetical protein